MDTGLGEPAGPDRLIDVADTDAALAPGEADLARRVLAQRPVDGRAYRILGQDAALAGRARLAQRLHEIAIAYWPRDRLARGVLAEQALLREELGTALVHIDALLRVAPETAPDVLAMFTPHLADAGLRDAFLARLVLDPPWRGALATALLSPDASAEGGDALLATLAVTLPPNPAEQRARMALLERMGYADRARTLWLSALPERARRDAAYLFDGGFEHAGLEPGPGYGWRLDAPAGVDVGYDTFGAHEGGSHLRLAFTGRAVQLGGIAQHVVLTPGRYRLQAAARGSVDSARPFTWQIACRDGGAALARLPLTVSNEWRSVQTEFAVPATACAVQTLQLRHESRSLQERTLSGELHLDGLGIFPIR